MGADGAGPDGTGNAPGSNGGTSIMNPVPDALAFPESGSRLKVRTVSGSDGSANLIAGQFYDSELDDNCSPGRAADGVTRCLPNADGLVGLFFSDSGCSIPVAALTKGCSAPKHMRWVKTGATCTTGSTTSVALIGSQYVPTELYYGTPESCGTLTAALSSYNDLYDFYAVGAELPASTFVQVTEGTL